MAKWRSAADDPPALGVRVIATDGVMVGEAFLYGHQREWYRPYSKPWLNEYSRPVTHWQPLPSVKE